jgi:hypothetical protein
LNLLSEVATVNRLRYLGLMAAIGAFAIFLQPHPASAAGATPRDLPRPSGTTGHLAANAGPYSQHPGHSDRGKSTPRHASRQAQRTPVRHSHPRPKSGGFALINRNLEPDTHVYGSRALSFVPHFHSRIDDLVCSGRGPPVARTSFSASRTPIASRSAVRRPASEPQVVSPTASFLDPITELHPPGYVRPGRAVRREGTAARRITPSLGGTS